MSWIKVQRGSFDFGATEDTDTVTLGTAVGALSKAFARITGAQKVSGGVAAGDTADKNNDDLGMTCVLTATDTVTFARYSTGENVDYRVYWEVWEYVGEPGGAGEFVVRYHDNVTIATGLAFVEQAVSGIVTLADCVPFIGGISSNQTTQAWFRAACTAEMISSSGDKVRVECDQTSGVVIASVAVVEFTGSAWSVENNVEHTMTAVETDETETISDVEDWSTAFVESGMRTYRNTNRDIGWVVRPGATTTTVRFRIRAGAVGDHVIIAHVVQHPSLVIEHLDSITGGETDLPAGSASPQTIEVPITWIADLGVAAIIATADSDGTAAQYPRPFWLYRLLDDDATRIEFWRGRHGSTGDWAAQAIQFLPTGVPRTVQTEVAAAPTDSASHWGDYEYSDTVYGAPGDIAAARLVYMNREGPNFRKLADIIDQRYGTLSSALAGIRERLDPETAAGDQIEIVASLVGETRAGRTDSRLRRTALATGLALANDSCTATQLGKVLGAWAGYADGEVLTYSPPEITVVGRVRFEDETQLWRLLWTAITAGTKLTVYGWDSPFPPLRGDHDEAISNPGISDYTDDPIDDAAATAYVLPETP